MVGSSFDVAITIVRFYHALQADVVDVQRKFSKTRVRLPPTPQSLACHNLGSLGFDCCGVQWKEMFVIAINGENYEYAMAA